MIQPFETSKGKFLAVLMPELFISALANMGYLLIKTWNEKNGVTMEQLEDYDKLQKYLANHNPAKEYNEQAIKIPFEEAKVIGLSEKITEEQAMEIVEMGYSAMEYRIKPDNIEGLEHSIDSYGRDLWTKITKTFYKDYSKKAGFRQMCHTASVPTGVESFESLMVSINCLTENPFKEPEEKDYNMGNHHLEGGKVNFSFDKIRFKKAKERSGQWLIIKQI